MTPRGIRNNNPLNLRISDNPWRGKISPNTDESFEQFDTIDNGIRAAFINLRTHLRNDKHHSIHTSVRREIHRWAPPTENDSDHYVELVCKEANLTPNLIIKFEDKNIICRMLWAMAFVENGVHVPFHLFERTYALL